MQVRITPVILTLDEASNLARTLDGLAWASDIILVDSGSTDSTLEIASKYPRVRVFQRAFDTHANQWNFAISQASMTADWILALDADYVLPDAFVEELRNLNPGAGTAGYRAGFRYCIDGVPLHGTAYPPVTVLFRRDRAHYEQDGHTQRVRIDGKIADLRTRIDHDDRKPLERWFRSQIRYMQLECEKLGRRRFSEAPFRDRVRKLIFVAPVSMFFYCMFVKGNVLDGRAGLQYALQRSVAEVILSLFLLEARFAPRDPPK